MYMGAQGVRILINSGFRLGYSLVHTLRVCGNVLKIIPELFSIGVYMKANEQAQNW